MGCHFFFFAYITKGLYISMYKEGDTVKKYATRIHGKKTNLVTLSICTSHNYYCVDFDVAFTYNEIELRESMVWKSIDARFYSNARK